MVAEMRLERLELDNRRHFTPEKKPIETARQHIDRWTMPREAKPVEVVTSKSAGNLNTAAQHDLIEME